MSAEVETMMYVREVPWHGLGTKVEEAPTSLEALELAGLNWTVEPEPIFISGSDAPVPNAVANVRSSDRSVLGIVTGRYRIVQNVDAFAFTDALLGFGGVRYETAGSLMGGRKIWLLARMPKVKILDDDVEPFLCFTNSHDGSGAVRCMMTPVRVVCANTLNLALNTARRSWSVKHTTNINYRLLEAGQTLGLANLYMSRLNEQAERLVEVRIDMEQVLEIVKAMFPSKEGDSRTVKKNAQAAVDNYTACYLAPDLQQYQGTAWCAINAMADMVAHVKPFRQSQTYAENNWIRIMNGHSLVDQMAAAVAVK